MAKLEMEGFDVLVRGLSVVAPTVVNKMAFSAVAKTAAEGRKKEMRTAHSLALGLLQHSVRKRKDGSREVVERINLKRSPAGWVSTTRTSSKTGAFQMAHFAWERAKKKDQANAEYSNLLANLWHRPSRPYRADSPAVGQGWDSNNWVKIKQGKRRRVRYRWAEVYSALASSMNPAIRRTEAEWMPKLLGDKK